MSARKFIEKLEQLGMLDDTVLADLRKQLAEQKQRVTAELIAKTLVEKGHLTKFQATKLIGEITTEPEPKSAEEDDLLGLAPLDDDLPPVPAKPVAKPPEPKPPEPKTPASKGPSPKPPEPKTPAKPSAAKPAAGGKPEPPKKVPAKPQTNLTELEPLEELVPLDDSPSSQGLTPIGGPSSGLTPLTPISDPSSGLSPIELGYHDATGGLMGAGDSAGMMGGDAFGQPAAGTPRPPKARKAKKNVWDTKTIVLGSGALLFMIVGGVWLYYSLFAQSASELLAKADDDYKNGNYAQARVHYENFLKGFVGDENESHVRVRTGMCRIRLALEVQKDFDQALKAIEEELPKVETEKAFGDARNELQTILPDIAAGFAVQGKNAKTTAKAEEFVKLTEKSLEFVNNPSYLPTSMRKNQEPKIDAIMDDLSRAKRAIDQEHQLEQTVAEIEAAIAQHDTAKAFLAYRNLLNDYPGLDKDERLQNAVLIISQKERELVKLNDEPPREVPAEAAKADRQIILANRVGTNDAPGVENRAFVLLIRGSAYGLNAANGKLLWRRYVGLETQILPQSIGAGGADTLLADERRHEVMRVRAMTGEVAWRFPVQEPFAAPVIVGEQVFVPTRSGKVLVLAAATGQAAKSILFPQKLSQGPGFTTDGTQVFQLGDHSNLYTLATDTLNCTDVFFVGHKAGSMACPPIYTQSHILLVENISREVSQVHVVATRAGEPMKIVQEPIRLKGIVSVPPIVLGRRVLIVTDLAAINVLDVDATKNEKPVTIAAQLPATGQSSMMSYSAVDQSRLWIADQRMTRYDIQFAQSKIARAWIVFEGDTFVGPPQRIGDIVVSIRRPKGSSAHVVTAQHGDSRAVFWQTELAVPVGYVAASPGGLRAISATATMFNLTKDVISSGFTSAADFAAPAGKGGSFTQPIEMPDGQFAIYSPRDHERILVYDGSSESAPIRIITRPPTAGQITAPPVFFAGGLLVPADVGFVSLIDPRNGNELAQPFQPRIEAGSRLNWRRPALLPGGKEFVIADDKQNVYRLGIKEQPQRHLAVLQEVALEILFVSPLAAAGEHVFGVVRAAGGDSLVGLHASDLKLAKESSLQGRAIWGPEPVGDVVLLQTDQEGLICLDGEGKSRWTLDTSAYGPIVGRPTNVNGLLSFASGTGFVWSVAMDSGKEIAKLDVGEPLASGPIVFANRLLLCGTDGSLSVVTLAAQP